MNVKIIYFGMTQLSFAINPGVWVQTTRCWAPRVMLCFPENRYVISESDSCTASCRAPPLYKNNCDILCFGQRNTVIISIFFIFLFFHKERVSRNRDLWHRRSWVISNCRANGNDVAAAVCPVLQTSAGSAASIRVHLSTTSVSIPYLMLRRKLVGCAAVVRCGSGNRPHCVTWSWHQITVTCDWQIQRDADCDCGNRAQLQAPDTTKSRRQGGKKYFSNESKCNLLHFSISSSEDIFSLEETPKLMLWLWYDITNDYH